MEFFLSRTICHYLIDIKIIVTPNQLILIKGRFERMEIVTLIVKTADYFSRLSQPSGPTFLYEKDNGQINCDFFPKEYL